MFNQDPHLLIPTVCLASDRVFCFSLNEHVGRDNNTDFTNVIKSGAQDYQIYFNGQLRKEDIGHAIRHWTSDQGVLDEFIFLQKLSDDFLLWQGDRFEVRSERLEAWLMLCSLMDPAWIIGCAFRQLIMSNVLSERDLVHILTKNQCPFALPTDNSSKCYADNHVHLNGHGYSSLSMLHFSLYLNEKYQPKKLMWPRRNEYTLFESGRLDKNILPLWVSYYAGCLQSAIYTPNMELNYTDILAVETLKTIVPRRNKTLSTMIGNYAVLTPQQRILQWVHQQDLRGHSRWLLFCCGLMLDRKDSYYSSCLSNFIRASNILRNYMVVSAVGLGQFVEYFGFNLRRIDKRYSQQESISYDLSPSIFREYRVSPDFVTSKGNESYNISLGNLSNFTSECEKNEITEQAHLVIHFTRNFPNKGNTQDKWLKKFRINLLEQVRKLQDFSASVTMSDVGYYTDISKKTRSLDMRKLIRGYDVAGNENELPIEVFSPILRVLRSGKHNSCSEFSSRLPRPFITVHAGEDYSHLLSGLRSVDEAVEFCQLRGGDRIGHGLALGIDVWSWAKGQHRAYLTVGQHLDNLVWCYYQSLQLSQYTSDHIPVMHLLREKIHFWCQAIFGEEFSPNELYQAWLLRRNWPEYEDMKI